MPLPDKRQNKIIPRKGVTSHSLNSLTKHARSIDDILAHSDVNEVLEKVVSKKSDIAEIIIIYKLNNDDQSRWVASDLEYRECLWLLETVKQSLFNDDDIED